MNYYLLGAGAVSGLSLVSWIIYAELRLRALQASLLKSQVEAKDAEITSKMRTLSDAELDALLLKNLGSGNSKT